MNQEDDKVEKNSNIMDIYDNIDQLSEQIQSIKEDLNILYPIDSLHKNNHRIENLEKNFNSLTDRINRLEQYKTNLEGLSKQNEKLKLDKVKENDKRIQKHYSMIVGYLSLLFIGASSLLLYIFAFIASLFNIGPMIIMTLVICGLLALLIMAIVLMYFANKTQKYLIQKD